MHFDFQFKIWDIKQNKWLEEGQYTLNDVFYWEDNNTINYYKDKFILIRALGNKDKHGNMVYDGSIIKYMKRIFIVKWFKNAGGFFSCIRTDDKDSFPCLNIGTLKATEVVGHELENTELKESLNLGDE